MRIRIKKGFTLVELVIVIAIIAIVAAIAIPSINQLITNAKEAAIMANIKTVQNAANTALAQMETEGLTLTESDNLENPGAFILFYSNNNVFDCYPTSNQSFASDLKRRISSIVGSNQEFGYRIAYQKNRSDGIGLTTKMAIGYFPDKNNFFDYYIYENGQLTHTQEKE